MSPKTKALLTSFGRVLLGCLVAAYTAVVGFDPPWTIDGDEAAKLANALWGAGLVTVVNYYRKGETRFGQGAKDTGMGGDDALEVGGKIQLPPDGEPVDPPADDPRLAMAAEQAGADAETPVQTDNGPRAEEGERLSSRQGVVFSGEMR